VHREGPFATGIRALPAFLPHQVGGLISTVPVDGVQSALPLPPWIPLFSRIPAHSNSGCRRRARARAYRHRHPARPCRRPATRQHHERGDFCLAQQGGRARSVSADDEGLRGERRRGGGAPKQDTPQPPSFTLSFFLSLSFPHRSVVDLVGGTPLVRLRKVVPRSKDTAKVFAKLESMQPNSSVKDR